MDDVQQLQQAEEVRCEGVQQKTASQAGQALMSDWQIAVSQSPLLRSEMQRLLAAVEAAQEVTARLSSGETHNVEELCGRFLDNIQARFGEGGRGLSSPGGILDPLCLMGTPAGGVQACLLPWACGGAPACPLVMSCPGHVLSPPLVSCCAQESQAALMGLAAKYAEPLPYENNAVGPQLAAEAAREQLAAAEAQLAALMQQAAGGHPGAQPGPGPAG